VVQAAAPARLIEGGIPTEATVAQVLVSKYADQLPLYRQAQIYKRQGVDLDRSTLADWVGRAAWHLRILEHLKASSKLFADEMTAPVLDPGRGKTKTGQFWAYARAMAGSRPARCRLCLCADRKSDRPMVAAGNSVSLAFCWSHVRRRFYELAAAGPAAAPYGPGPAPVPFSEIPPQGLTLPHRPRRKDAPRLLTPSVESTY